MDYTIRYGLEFNPFLKNSKEIFVSTDESKEVLFRLDYLAKTKGFDLLTGSPGRGKTTAIRAWRQELNNSQYKVVYTCFSTFSPNDFYRDLAAESGAQSHYRKPDIKLLFNFEMDSGDRAVVLLSGLPPLNATLRPSVHEPLRQRIIMNYEILAFTKEEERSYILEKLQGAGAARAIFEDAALEALLNASDGTPRVINNLCNSCLLIGDSRKSDMITAEIVMQAINNNEIWQQKQGNLLLLHFL